MAAPVLNPGEFQLGDVVWGRWGYDSGLGIDHGDGWDRGEWGVSDQDAPRPGSDGIVFGEDVAQPPIWTWNVTSWAPTAGEALAQAKRLAAVWSDRAWRSSPGTQATLWYNEHGETRFVRGRPRKIAIGNPAYMGAGYCTVTMSFQLSETVSWSTTSESMSFDLVQTTTAEPILLPIPVLPTILGSMSNTREGFVTLDVPTGTPFKLTIHGPVTGVASGIKLRALPLYDADSRYYPWTIDLAGVVVKPNEILVVDTARGVVTRNGKNVVVGVGARAALRSRLPQGTTELVYEASDPSLTSTATLSWSTGEPV